MIDEEKHKVRLKELEKLPKRQFKAKQQIELYQAQISAACNIKVKDRTFKKGDRVLAVRRPIVMAHKTNGKFQTKWDGPFVVETVYSNGVYSLINFDGNTLISPING